ncbi:hypothetical protein CANTEDRAFT_105288 [Yamadazyma tenuis ATCC 10573]|uniref:Phosphoinositide phospholipase C n=2 Tax=Candida tenuis TaxID=2315449 RepID=G3B2Z3_CANTC|nr:uncharacterized protein CANTEDRAFT_105288 [Yamadazyma tenuis ATCC 10573]EGV64040.1 hypothetical protein CANTEDRAFT_105288 [Yamadazyma tenuis ATCC 10573]
MSKRRLSSPRLFSVKSNDSNSIDDVEFSPLKNKDAHVKIPSIFFEDGMSLLKVSSKSKKRIYFHIDPQTWMFIWNVANKSINPSILPVLNIQKLFTTTTIASKKLQKFTIDDVKKVLYQQEARHFRDELNISQEFENQWITISYFNATKKKMKTLHLIADTEVDAKRFFSTINNLKKLRAQLSDKFYIDLDNMDEEQKELVMMNSTSSPSKPQKEYLSFDDIVKYIARLNINISRNHLRTIFDSLDFKTVVNDVRVINFEEFKEFIALLKRRDDIDHIWDQICGASGASKEMDFRSFKKFISKVQGENFDDETNDKLFYKFCNDTNQWTTESLNQFLLSKYSKPIIEGSHDDDYYNQPLNEYYISSSHNTYLTGRQVADDSSSEGYVKTLQKGCRCVEIDIWDGDNMVTDVEPVVCHGRSFTTSISLRNVLTTIKRYAFVASSFPLILSLEINCSPEAQLQTRNLLLEILGELLVIQPLKGVALLPSPNDLKFKIILKIKKTTPHHLVLTETGSLTSSTASTSFSEDNGSTTSSTSNLSSGKKRKKKQVIDDLSDLAVYVQGQKFRNFSLPESKTFNHCFSLSEKTIDLMLKDETKQKSVDKHNRKFFMRVYPSSMRLRSSNFIPISYWTHGVQMAATNWQTYDLGQQINEALFDGKDKVGYFLKPKDFRKPLVKHTMRNILHLEEKRIKFNITIISAHQLPKPKNKDTVGINPFVKLDVIGARDIHYDNGSAVNQTSIVAENGFNPTWNESFSGTMVANQLLFLKLSLRTMVSKDNDLLLGVFVCRLENLKGGYRYLPLNDALGEELIYSSLLVHIAYDKA